MACVAEAGSGRRAARPNLFYPLFFSKTDGSFIGAGQSLPLEMDRNDIQVPNNAFVVFPLSSDGTEMRWGIERSTFCQKLEKGYIQFGKWKPGSTWRSVSHLQSGTIERIKDGKIPVLGKNEDGTLILGTEKKIIRPMTNVDKTLAQRWGLWFNASAFNNSKSKVPVPEVTVCSRGYTAIYGRG